MGESLEAKVRFDQYGSLSIEEWNLGVAAEIRILHSELLVEYIVC